MLRCLAQGRGVNNHPVMQPRHTITECWQQRMGEASVSGEWEMTAHDWMLVSEEVKHSQQEVAAQYTMFRKYGHELMKRIRCKTTRSQLKSNVLFLWDIIEPCAEIPVYCFRPLDSNRSSDNCLLLFWLHYLLLLIWKQHMAGLHTILIQSKS